MAERELAILVRARDLASKTLKSVGKEVDTLSGKAGKGLATTAKNLGKLSIAGAGLAVVLTAGAVNAAGDFEAQLNTINTVAQATPERLEAIGDGIRQIARDTGAPLEELTQGFYDLVSAGIDSGQAMKVLASSNRLAIGGLATAAEGVDLITTALNSYGVALQDQGAESERFADIFAKAIERGKVTAAELAQSFAQIGPLAASNGIEIEELAAAYATLTAKGVPAAEAATQMSSAIIALTRRTGALEKLEKQTGKSYLAIAGNKGLVVALQELRKDADKAGVPLIDLLGRQEALGLAINTTGDAMATYNDNLAAMSDANGTAARQMSERQQGLNYQLARLKALAIDAGITIGSKLIPKLVPLAEKLLALVTGHEADIERFGDNLATAFDKAIEFGERIPWSAIGSGLQTAAEWAGKLMDVFLGLPPEVQTTIIALAGLNKLSGGAISGIVGELGKGLIKGVLGMTAGVVNINAGVVNGVGGALPGAATAAAGAATTAGGLTAGGLATAVAVPTVIIGGTVLSLLEINNKYLAENNRLAAQGLTAAEITAFKYFSGTPAYQQAALKHLGAAPSKADYETALAKLAAHDAQLSGEGASRQNIANERLEAIRAANDAQTAKADALNAKFDSNITASNAIKAAVDAQKAADASNARLQVIANERTESLTRSTILSGDTRTESAIARNASTVSSRIMTDSASERAAISRAGQEAKSGGLSAATAIRNKRMSTTVAVTSIANFDYRGSVRVGRSYSKIGTAAVAS